MNGTRDQSTIYSHAGERPRIESTVKMSDVVAERALVVHPSDTKAVEAHQHSHAARLLQDLRYGSKQATGTETMRLESSSSTSTSESMKHVAVEDEESDEETKCPICLGEVKDPATVDCVRHVFCLGCINEHLRLGGRSCPLDQMEVTFIATANEHRILCVEHAPTAIDPYVAQLAREFVMSIVGLRRVARRVRNIAHYNNGEILDVDEEDAVQETHPDNLRRNVYQHIVYRTTLFREWSTFRNPTITALAMVCNLVLGLPVVGAELLLLFYYDPWLIQITVFICFGFCVYHAKKQDMTTLRGSGAILLSLIIMLLVMFDALATMYDKDFGRTPILFALRVLLRLFWLGILQLYAWLAQDEGRFR